MKAAIISDQHREFWEIEIPAYSSEIVIITGDISCPIEQSMDFLLSYSNKIRKPVIAVLGNHDFYNCNIDKARVFANEKAKESKYLYFLDNSSCIIDNIRFIGSTLWTDFSYMTNGNISKQEENAYLAQAGISDFYLIKLKNGKNFSAFKSIQLFNESKSYLIDELEKPFTGKTVVVTHFAPDIRCNNPKHRDNKLVPYFISNVSDLTEKYNIDIWVYGHTHYSNTFKMNNTQVIGNHIGYPTESEKDTRSKIEFYIDI